MYKEMLTKGILRIMEPDSEGIYYFLGNITSHILHALPVQKALGGTFVVLSRKAKHEVETYGVPVIALDDKPFRIKRYGYRIKPEYEYLQIDKSFKKTADFLNKHAKIVLFYELYDFAEPVRLTKPKTVFLTHGNMLKDYMSSNNRLEILKQYDYMAAMGPYMKQKLLESGVEPSKLVDIGIARTDDIVKNKSKVVISPALSTIANFDPNKMIISYLPTFWGASSVYDTGIDIVRNMPEEYTLLFRPHPQTPEKLLNKYVDIMQHKSNVFYAPEGAYEGVGLIEIFNASSAIIGDVSSVMLEAILTEKPLIFAYGNDHHRQAQEDYTAIADVVEVSGKLTSSAATTNLGNTMRGTLAKGINTTIWQKTINNTFFHANGTSVAAIETFVRSQI